jgi:hypothetical protein
MGVAASCTNCWRGDGPTTTKVRQISSTEDVAAYNDPTYNDAASPIDREIRSVGTNAISPSPASHFHGSGTQQHSPIASKVGSLPHQIMANSGRSIERSSGSIDRGTRVPYRPPESPSVRPPEQGLADSTSSSSSSNDYEMPEEQAQEQQAVDGFMFDGRVETSPAAAQQFSPSPVQPRRTAPAYSGVSPSGTRAGDVALEQKNRSSWDRGSSSSDEEGAPKRRRMGGFVPGVGPTKVPPNSSAPAPAAYQCASTSNNDVDDDDGDGDGDYQGPEEDVPAQQSGPVAPSFM